MPFFSIVIPAYNRAGLLREALASIFEQHFSDFEIIVVDDGSSDNTAAVSFEYGPRIRFLRQDNKGPGAARNLGIQKSAGRYVAFLDSDDLWFPWSLRTYATIARTQGEPAFIVGKSKLFRDASTLSTVQPEPMNVLCFADYLVSGDEWRWWGVSSFVIRRDMLEAIGGFAGEPLNGEDADLALRLGTASGFVQVLQPTTFAYREHGSNEMKNHGRTLAGARRMVNQERAGVYPGGQDRARERRRILMRHVRPVTLSCLKAGCVREGWNLYARSFWWNLMLGRIRYLGGYPLLALASIVGRRIRNSKTGRSETRKHYNRTEI